MPTDSARAGTARPAAPALPVPFSIRLPFRSRIGLSVASAVLVVLLGILPVALLLWSGRLPETHESTRYLVLADHFRAAFANGAWYPRWLPYLNGGFGYPTFIFYQPAYFYLNLLFSVLQEHPLGQMLLTIVAMTQLGAAGVYLLLRQYCNRQTSILGLLLFVMTPYLYVNLYVRGDLSEYLAMMMMPWPVYFLLRIKAACAINQNPTALVAIGLSLSLAFAILAHPVTLLFFLPAFCLLAVALWLELDKSRRGGFFLESLIGVFFALALSAPYWATVITMRPFALVDNATSIHATDHVVAVAQWFSRFYGFEYSVPGPNDGMSFQLGLPHFLLALAGAWVGRRRWLILGSFVCYAALMVIMTRFGPWAWNTPWRFAQFPWRALSALALFQVMSFTGLGLLRARPRTVATLVVIGIAVCIAWYLPVFQMRPGPSYALADLKKDNEEALSVPLTFRSTFAAIGEWTPVKSSKLYMTEPTGSIISVPHTASARPLDDHTRYDLHYLVTLGAAGTVIVNQIYFPGWRIELDGKVLPQAEIARSLLEDGRMAISVPAGTHELRAKYDGPLGWQTAIAVTGFAIWLIFRLVRWRSQRGGAAPVTLSGAGQAPMPRAIVALLLIVCIGLVLARARDSGDINLDRAQPLEFRPWDRPLAFRTGLRGDGVFWSLTGDGLDGARLFVSSRPGILTELPLTGGLPGRPVDPGAPLDVIVIAPDHRKVKFAEFNFAIGDEEVRGDVMTFHEVNGKLATVQAASCSIDSMNVTKGGYQRHRTLDLSGTVRPAGKYLLESSIEVLLSGTHKPHKFMAHAVRVKREDDALLGVYDNAHVSGFVLKGADISMLPEDTYRVSIVQRSKGTETVCDSGALLSVD